MVWYRKVVKENIYAIISQMVIFLAGVVVTIIFPNILGRMEFGYFSIILSVVGVSYFLSDFGLQQATLYFLPKGLKRKCARSYLIHLYKTRIALSLSLALLLYAISDHLALNVYNLAILAPGFKLGALVLFLNSLMLFLDSAFIGLRRAEFSLAILLIYNIGRVVFPLLVFFVFLQNYLGLLIGLVASLFLTLLVAHPLLGALKPVRSGRKEEIKPNLLREFLKGALIFVVSINLISWSDTIIVGLLRPPDELAIYRVAWLWASALGLILPFSSKVLLSAHSYENTSASKAIMIKSLKYSFIYAFMMIGGTILFSKSFLGFTYGVKYLSSAPLLALFSLFALDQSMYINCCPLIVGKGRVKRAAAVLFIGAIVQIILTYFATIKWGLLGAAAAVVSVRMITFLIISLLAFRIIGAKLPANYLLKPALISVGLVMLFSFIEFHGILKTFFAAALFVLSYILIIFITKTLSMREITNIIKSFIS